MSNQQFHHQSVDLFRHGSELVIPSSCVLDKLYTAGCFANMSYIFSTLHPDTIDTITHPDTRQLIQMHENVALDIYDSNDDPQVGAILIPKDDTITIAIHGINFDRRMDHIVNLESTLVPSNFAPGLYHSGLLKLTNNLLNNILPILKSYSNVKHLNIYGHSMGAAIAQILTQYMQHKHPEYNLETIVFGSPKVMCPIAAKAYNLKNQKRTLRVENTLDLAVYMPTQLMGYSTVDMPIVLPNPHRNMARNHAIEGYLDLLDITRQDFRNKGIDVISLEMLQKAYKGSYVPYYWNAIPQIQTSSMREFLSLLTQHINKGIQWIVKQLPL